MVMGRCFEQLQVSDGTRCIPVYLEESSTARYEEGYVSEVLHPLFHYIPMTNTVSNIVAGDSRWEDYVRANKTYANEVCKVYRETIQAELDGKVHRPCGTSPPLP